MSASPLLFCLSLEPLAQAIRKSEVSIKIHDHNHSISLYADDIILYLDHFDVSVSSIIKEFDNFSGLSGYKINWSKFKHRKKGDNYKFGPVVANSIKIWKTVERRIGGPFKFCNSTTLWHNFNFVCGNRPFVQPSWSSLGVNTCGDIYDNQGLCSFQTIRTKFCLPASAYFVFLQLRSALKAYGVPWASSISSHPMRDWIAPSAGRPSVSLIYNKIIYCITKPFY